MERMLGVRLAMLRMIVDDDEYSIDDDDDDDYKADESADSSENESVPLARYLRPNKPASKQSHKQSSSVGGSSAMADPTVIIDGFGDCPKQSMFESFSQIVWVIWGWSFQKQCKWFF